jgi:hypothetical protein
MVSWSPAHEKREDRERIDHETEQPNGWKKRKRLKIRRLWLSLSPFLLLPDARIEEKQNCFFFFPKTPRSPGKRAKVFFEQ